MCGSAKRALGAALGAGCKKAREDVVLRARQVLFERTGSTPPAVREPGDFNVPTVAEASPCVGAASPAGSDDGPRSRAGDEYVWTGNGCDTALNPVLGVLVVESASGVPQRPLVAVRGDSAGVLEDSGQVQQVPGQKGRVAVGEVVLGPA